MPSLVTSAKLFVSSPSDVAEERTAIIRVVERINRLPHVREKYVLQPFRYEEIAPQVGTEPQLVVDRACEVGECYFVVCLFWQRMGTPFVHPVSQERFLSGSHYEFISAFKAREESNGCYPHILLYRKLTKETEKADPNQAKLVEEFFDMLEGEHADIKALYSGFDSVDQFENEIFQHLLEILHNNPPEQSPELHVPKIVEEDRRLEVAVPSVASHEDVVEVWVKVCLSESEGLKQELPELAEFSGAPIKDDAREKFMAVAFEEDPKTQQLLPLPTEVSIRTSDFDVLDEVRSIELHPGRDSSTVIFALKPITTSNSAMIQILVRTKSMHSKHWIENSSMIRRMRLTGSTQDSLALSNTIKSTKIVEEKRGVFVEAFGDASSEMSESKRPSPAMNYPAPENRWSRSRKLLGIASAIAPVLILGLFFSSINSDASKSKEEVGSARLLPENNEQFELALMELRKMKAKFSAEVKDYTAVLIKGDTSGQSQLALKVRLASEEPGGSSLYARHIGRDSLQGQEQIWSPDFGGRVAFHERLGTSQGARTHFVDPNDPLISGNPDSGEALTKSGIGYPITEWGLEKMHSRIQSLLEGISNSASYSVKRKEEALGGKSVEVVMIETSGDVADQKFNLLKYYVDKEYGFQLDIRYSEVR